MKDFTRELNASKWKGTITEVGIGVPFQAEYMSYPGASKTILFTRSPYSKEFQPTYAGRSNSEEMASALAHNDSKLTVGKADSRFNLAFTGTHSTTKETHGWISLLTNEVKSWKPYKSIMWEYTVHVKLPDNYPGADYEARKAAGADYSKIIQWLMEMALLNRWGSWSEAIINMPENHGIVDVLTGYNLELVGNKYVSTPLITTDDQLHLLKFGHPLVFHDRQPQRVTSFLRRYNRIFRGSFNPITIAHEQMGGGALFEINTYNARKGLISIQDLAHRIRMINLTGNPVMVNDEMPYFVDLHKKLTSLNEREYEYIVGVDTFNAIVAPGYVPNATYLAPLRENAKFIVYHRDGMPVTENAESLLLNFTTVDSSISGFSSTSVRNGEGEQMVSDEVANYIQENRLY